MVSAQVNSATSERPLKNPQFGPLLRAYVMDIDRRARRLRLLQAAGFAGVSIILWMLAACGLDRLFQLSALARLALLTVGTAIGLAFVVPRAVAALRPRFNWIDASLLAERVDPEMRQRLMTAASQVYGPVHARGSPAMLGAILDDLELRAFKLRRRKPPLAISWRRPWAILIAVSIAVTGLALLRPALSGQLARRYFLPLADVPPVTFTQLSVPTGSCAVAQSASLNIVANATHLGDRSVTVYWRDDSSTWTEATMLPASQKSETYSFEISAVDRDLRYYVRAGDAVSDTYQVSVLRKPAVVEYRIRYNYPAYTSQPPLTVVTTDGLIEAPQGATAEVSLIGTEPLASATLEAAAGPVVPMLAGDGDRHFQVKLPVDSDARYVVSLISRRNVRSTSSVLRVRAIPDLRPMARLQKTGQLRLNPGDILPLPYQAIDDYSLANAKVLAQVNGRDIAAFDLPANGMRRLEGICNVDLATLPVRIGDLVSLTLLVSDGHGQTTRSEPAQVNIAPRSIDMATYRRIAELAAATEMADGLAEQLAAAANAMEEAERQRLDSMDSGATLARSNRHLTGSAEAAGQLRQILLRALVQSHSADLSTALGNWIDSAQTIAFEAEDLFRRNGVPSGMGEEARQSLGLNRARAAELRDQLRIVFQGEQANALLADRENLSAAVAANSAPVNDADKDRLDRMRTSAARAKQEIDAGARQIGLNPDAADLDDRLRERSAAATNLLHTIQPVDYAVAAADWARSIREDSGKWRNFSGRMSVAAQAQAIRNDADLIWAHDLELASRAGARIEEKLAAPRWAGRQEFDSKTPSQLASAIADVQQEYRLRHDPQANAAADQNTGLRRAARMSRVAMAEWGGRTTDDTDGFSIGSVAPEQSLALSASAQAAERDYERAASIDQKLLDRLQTRAASLGDSAERIERNFQRVDQAMVRARRLDLIGGEQAQLLDQPVSTGVTEGVATRQRGVAEAIATVAPPAARIAAAPGDDDPGWREKATAALVSAQETLATVPQRLTRAQESLAAQRQLRARADDAQVTADQAVTEQWSDTDRQQAAQRAAEQASQDVAGAAGRTAQSLRPISPAEVRTMISALEPFVPDTSGAVLALGRQLLPALQELERQAASGDLAGAQRSLDAARQAVTSVQRELQRAQDTYIQRDPLAAARSFARAAADSLAQQPPDLPAAQHHQQNTSAALSLAWDESIHEAAAYRLASLPNLQGVYDVSPASPPGATPAALAPAKPGLLPLLNLVAERGWGWGKLRPRATPDLAPSSGDADPPGYEESLRMYFDALARAQTAPAQQPTTQP